MPELSRGALALFILVYVVAQIAIGLWFARGAKSDTDYYLAGRRLGVLPLTLSIFATWFGAETILGSSAAIAEDGLAGARAEPFGYALCLVAMALFIAGSIRSKGYVTIADFFRDRFGPRAELVAAAVSVVISVIWAGAQLLAVSAILETTLGIPGLITLFAAAAIVIFYSYFGGMMGDVATDVIQGVLLIAGVVVLFVGVAIKFGGLGELLASIEPGQLNLVAPGENWFGRVDSWAIPVIGSLITQEVIARFLAARSISVARTACFSAAGLYLLVGSLPVLIGLSGAHLNAPGAVGDNFIPALTIATLPPLLSIVFIGALFSAILSTVDSNLLAVSSLVSINLLRRFHAHASEKLQLRTARLATVGAGLAALGVAMTGSSIYELNAMTSVLGQGGILVATLFGMKTAFGGGRAALAAIFTCVGVNTVTLLILPLRDALAAGMASGEALSAVFAGDIEPIAGFFLFSVGASFAAYVLFGIFEKRASAVATEAAE